MNTFLEWWVAILAALGAGYVVYLLITVLYDLFRAASTCIKSRLLLPPPAPKDRVAPRLAIRRERT